MDVREMKQKIDQLEEQGHYNEAIEWLYAQWMADKNNPMLCEMLIAECVWLFAYPGEYERAFPNVRFTFDFYDRMDAAMEYGFKAFQDDFMFQLRVGYMMYVEEPWFCSKKLGLTHKEIKQLREKMLARACELRPTSIVAQCVWRYAISEGKDDITKEKTDEIARELNSYPLGHTNDDLEFLRFFDVD